MADSLGTQLAKAVASSQVQGSASVQLATCMSTDEPNRLVTVNVGGGQVTVPCVGELPTPQHQCWVATLGKTMLCLGEQTRPAVGTVTGAPSGGLLPVKGEDGVTYSLAYNMAVASWSTGQKVLIDWRRGGTAVCALSADPYTHNDLIPAPPVITPPSGGAGQISITPAWSGSQNGSGTVGNGNFWSSQVWCGNTTLGGYGYNGVGSSIPDSAVYNGRCRIFLHQDSGFGAPFTLATHTLTARAGVLVVSNQITPQDAGGGWWELGATIFNLLKTGQAAGIATCHGGEHIFSPAGQNNSGALDIAWS